MDDKTLVQEVVAGKSQAYRQLVERYQAPLLRYASFLVHDSDLAEDIVQESFIKAYRNLRSYNPKYKFSSWLYRIVHNAAMDALPKHPISSLDDDSGVLEKYLAVEPDFAEQIDQDLMADNIMDCLAQLDAMYRAPVVLHYLDHKSYEEISDILHLTTSAVGVRINRAKQKLRDICRALGVQAT